MPAPTTKTELVAEIKRRLAKYRQYDHYHDDDKGWKFARVEKTIRFRSGDAYAGEYILIRESGAEYYYDIAHLTTGLAYARYHSEPSVMHCEVSAKTVEKSIEILE